MTGAECKTENEKPEVDCVFREILRDEEGYGSLMYKQSIQQVYSYTAVKVHERKSFC